MTERHHADSALVEPRRRRRLWPLVVLLLLGLPAAWLAWAVTWAFTATPEGSAGLDRSLAEIARWEPYGIAGPADDGSAHAAWLEVIDEHRTLRADLAAGLEPDAAAWESLGILDLARGDDEEPWQPSLEWSEAGSEPGRTMLRARAAALRDAGIIERLAGIARGPRPAVSAEQLAAMGYGTEFPIAILFMDLGHARTVAADLLGILHLDAPTGQRSAIPDLLLAVEGLARGAESCPTLVHALVTTGIRELAWETVADLAARGRLDVDAIDAATTILASESESVPPAVRRRRTLAGERATIGGVLGHLHDRRGRALVASWGDMTGDGPIAEGRLSNLVGLFAPRRDRVERRIDELLASGGRTGPMGGGLMDALGTEFLPNLLVPMVGGIDRRIARAADMDTLGRLALAIARHAAVTGSPPEALDELGLPAEALRDPHGTAGEPFQYERLEGPDGSPRWRLRSPGPRPDDPDDDLVLPPAP